mgnify:CR=1 FL=1
MLKNFFLKEENAPKAIIDFFKNPLSELYTKFVQSQMFLFEKQIKKLEKVIITTIEVKHILEDTKKTINEKIN